MDKRVECENTNEKLNETQKIIIEIVSKIKNEKYLRRIYISLKDYLKEEETE